MKIIKSPKFTKEDHDLLEQIMDLLDNLRIEDLDESYSDLQEEADKLFKQLDNFICLYID